MLVFGEGLFGLVAIECELAQHFRDAGDLRREALFQFIRQPLDGLLSRGFEHRLQALGHPGDGGFRAAVHLIAFELRAALRRAWPILPRPPEAAK